MSRPPWWQRAALPFAVALLLAAAARAAFPFDGLYGQDAFAYFRFARALGPHLRFDLPLPDLYWPRGYPVAVAALLPLTGGGPAAGQIVSALACAWAAAATYLLVQALEPRTAGRGAPLAAGLAVAASGAVLRTSQVVMADGLALGLAATAMLCAARFAVDRRGWWLVACAAALAWGAVTRWLVGLLALPLLAFWLIALRTRRDESAPPAAARARTLPWRWCALAIAAALAILIPQLVAAHAVPRSFEQHEWLEHWSPAHAFQRDFHTREGPTHYKLPVALFYLARLGWPDYLFPGVALFALSGLWIVVRERRWAAAALLAGWPLVVWLFISGIPYENPRFLLPTLPAIGALVGIGFARVVSRSRAKRESAAVSGSGSSHAGGRRVAVAGVFAASLVAGVALGAREHARVVVGHKNAGLAAVAWMARQVPAPATVLMSGGTLIFEHYGSTKVRDIFLLTPAALDALIADGGPYYYCEDPDEIASRWAGLSPALHQQALRAHGLSAVSRHPPYTLFRLEPAAR